MSARDDDSSTRGAPLLDLDDVQGVLSGSFYTKAHGGEPEKQPSRRGRASDPKPAHYKVICISMYTKDLERLDRLVDALKAKGLTKANRSALIRAALDQVDLEKVPRGI